MYKQALFCYEELLLFQPANPQYLVRLLDEFLLDIMPMCTQRNDLKYFIYWNLGLTWINVRL